MTSRFELKYLQINEIKYLFTIWLQIKNVLYLITHLSHLAFDSSLKYNSYINAFY